MAGSEREKYYFSLEQEEFEAVRQEIFNSETSKQNDPFLDEFLGQYTQAGLLAFNREQQLEFLGILMNRYVFQLQIKAETDNQTYEVGMRQFNINKKVRSVRKVTWEDFVIIYLPYMVELMHFFHKELHRPETTLVQWDVNRLNLIRYITSLTKEELAHFPSQYNRYWEVFYKAFRLPAINTHRMVKLHDKYAGYINARLGKEGKKHELTRPRLGAVSVMIGRQYAGIIMQTRSDRLRPGECNNYKNIVNFPNEVGKSDPYL